MPKIDAEKDLDKKIAALKDINTVSCTKKFQNYISEVSKASVAKQITVGGTAGWLSGYLSTKVGKIAAVSIGGSLLLLQVASHQGYIKVNWYKINKHMEKMQRELEKEAQKKLPTAIDETKRFVKENAILATAFAGGFLLGIASS